MAGRYQRTTTANWKQQLVVVNAQQRLPAWNQQLLVVNASQWLPGSNG